MSKLTKEELEDALKDTLFYLDLYIKEADKNNKEIDDWAYNIKDVLRGRLGREHTGTIGWSHYGVFKCWLVLEVWKDGKIIPRCVSLTEGRAEHVKDLLIDIYESEEPSKRPIISIEHQRMEHIFGYEMQHGRMRKTSDTFRPTKTKLDG